MMRKAHDIVPKSRPFKKAMLHLRLHIWARCFIACARHDDILKKEIGDWPSGFSFLIQILPDEPHIGLTKDSNGLHIIKTTQDVNGKVSELAFKSLVIGRDVFSGKMSIRQALIDKRFILNGDPSSGSSIIRSMIHVEDTLFPRLIQQGRLRRKNLKSVSRLRIFTEILLMRNNGKEASSNDSEVLRIFE